jgi:hypothetical protein
MEPRCIGSRSSPRRTLEPRDPATFVGASFTLAAVAALAGWIPAYRASRIDPAEVLREDQFSPAVVASFWEPRFPSQLPKRLVAAQELRTAISKVMS